MLNVLFNFKCLKRKQKTHKKLTKYTALIIFPIIGWFCFITAIFVIGFLTAIIGDVAAMFGCTIGLKDSVTAITLVALGTSLPGNFI